MYKSLFFLVYFFALTVETKYMEGEIKTNDNWAFLARFCFLSEEGQFEYHIEFNENQGDPNILLYYDTEDQWPSVYKSNKTCEERESVLNRGQNQIVNLTARDAFNREFSGCMFLPSVPTTYRPTYTLSIPTLPPRNATKKITTTVKQATLLFSPTTSMDNFETTTDYITSSSFSESTSEKYIETTYLEDDTSTTQNLKQEYETIGSQYLTTLPTLRKDVYIKNGPIKRSVPQPIKNLRIGRTVSCHNARRFRSSRERWWFIAISNCYGNQGIHVKYKILMTNGPPGDYWHEHFSADEFYILPVLMAFAIAYSFLMLGIVMCTIELKSRQLLHTTYKLFVVSVVLQLVGIMFQSIANLKYAVNGVGNSKAKRIGAVLMGASETFFLLLLLLLAKGFTVTRGRLPLPASIKLTIFMCIYVVTYISIFVYEARVFDPGEVLYLYESPAGYSLIILRVVAWCMFIYSTIFTLKHYPEKGNFYYPFNIFGTLWFVAGPAFILSANTYIDKWVRESVVCAVLLFITFGGHLMFLILTMPSMANKNFPYHVRTTQIGIMELTGTSGTSTIEQFSHHIYEPTNTLREQTVIIPLTRRTEEIFEGMYNQRTFRRNVNNDHVNEDDAQFNNPRDIALDNVLNWSLAKNVPSLELPGFDRVNKRSSIRSTMSNTSQNSIENDVLARRSSIRLPANDRPQIDDYVRDVPIELFTISKMVVTTNHENKNNMS